MVIRLITLAATNNTDKRLIDRINSYNDAQNEKRKLKKFAFFDEPFKSYGKLIAVETHFKPEHIPQSYYRLLNCYYKRWLVRE